MKTLISVVPELVSEMRAELISEGKEELARQLMEVSIARHTYDPTANAGYVYFVRPPSNSRVAPSMPPVAETLPLEVGPNLDIDHEGQLFGLELINRSDLIETLRRRVGPPN